MSWRASLRPLRNSKMQYLSSTTKARATMVSTRWPLIACLTKRARHSQQTTASYSLSCYRRTSSNISQFWLSYLRKSRSRFTAATCNKRIFLIIFSLRCRHSTQTCSSFQHLTIFVSICTKSLRLLNNWSTMRLAVRNNCKSHCRSWRAALNRSKSWLHRAASRSLKRTFKATDWTTSCWANRSTQFANRSTILG